VEAHQWRCGSCDDPSARHHQYAYLGVRGAGIRANIADLQQTPATAAKASIRITARENHTFTFTSPSARDDQQSITSTLREWISASKATENAATPTPVATPGANGTGLPAAMAIAQTAVSTPGGTRPDDDSYDDARLVKDGDLQRSLLSADPALRQRFDQALRDKPESISITQFVNQFWATRLHLLRSHAVEKAQGQGAYNVLSVVQPVGDNNGTMKLNMSKEQIQLIFTQHPIIKRVYNENVPPLKEAEFWSRFFFSRLIKQLRGEKIKESDTVDPKLDKYLDMDADDTSFSQQTTAVNIPRFLDVEGNEQNNSQQQGNAPDWTMRPSGYDKAPIIRTLNRMSEKMMTDIPLANTDRHGPVGMDEETYNELILRDLQRADEDNRVMLNIKEQSQLFAAGQGLHTSSSAAAYTKRTPAQVLSIVRSDLMTITASKSRDAGLNLKSAIGVKDDDSSSDEEESATSTRAKIGSRSTRAAASAQLINDINKQRLHNEDYLSSITTTAEQAVKLGLSRSVFDELSMTHNTTVEFLHYFWVVYLSGDPERAGEVQKLIETLDKSLDRIQVVADTAESERTAKIDQLKRENENYTQRTGKKRKWDPNTVTGGAKAVLEIARPLRRAIMSASKQFRVVYDEQLAQA
jgi:transcription initiation factor TFIIH subunit 1